MPPTKPQSSPQKKPIKKIKILQIKKSQQISLLSEHFYPILAVLFFVLTFVLYAMGYRFDEAAVIGLWVVAIIFTIRQVKRFIKGEARAPQKAKAPEKKQGPLASLPKKYTPPALPRVSKDFSPMPPAGDKRYPPPSPFIKPPNAK
jgi:hypothetical protein